YWLSTITLVISCMYITQLAFSLGMELPRAELSVLWRGPASYVLIILMATLLISLPFATKKLYSRKVIERLQGKLYTIMFSADEPLLLLTYAANLRKDVSSFKEGLPKPKWNSYLAESIPGFLDLLINAPFYLVLFYGSLYNLLFFGLIPMFGDS